jgi:hypothetical protein
MTPTPPAFRSDEHSRHLFEDVPFHQLFDKSLDKMNELELEALLKSTRAARVSPSVRKKLKTSAAKKITGVKKDLSASEDLSHLL